MAEPTLVLGRRYADAVEYAAQVHARHTRKGTQTAYMCHALAVSALVIEAGGDEDMAIAALLHDAAEDGGGKERLADIAKTFGPRVAYLVGACSDSLAAEGALKAPWRERKKAHLEHLLASDDAAAVIVAADKLHNARALWTDIQLDGMDTLARFNAQPAQVFWYYEESLKVLSRKNVSDVLLLPLTELVEILRPFLRAQGDEARRQRRAPNRTRPLPRDGWIVEDRGLLDEPIARHVLGRDVARAVDLVPGEPGEASLQYAVETAQQVLRSLPWARAEVLVSRPRWEIRVFQGARSDLVVAFRSDGTWVEFDGRPGAWSGVKEGGPDILGWSLADRYVRVQGGTALARPPRPTRGNPRPVEPGETPPAFLSMSEWTQCDKYGHEWTTLALESGIEVCGHCGHGR